MHDILDRSRRERAVRSSSAGFSLMEAALATFILSVLTAVAIPGFDIYVTASFEDETRAEMQKLTESVLRYARDVGTLPSGLEDLSIQPGEVARWQGPYISFGFADSSGWGEDHCYDAWREKYVYSVLDSRRCRIRSKGPDHLDDNGLGDDIEVFMDIASVFREITRDELETLNRAVDSYNRDRFPADPLSGTFAEVLSKLQTEGYLPSDAETTAKLSTDGWGNAYQLVGNPVIDIRSGGTP